MQTEFVNGVITAMGGVAKPNELPTATAARVTQDAMASLLLNSVNEWISGIDTAIGGQSPTPGSVPSAHEGGAAAPDAPATAQDDAQDSGSAHPPQSAPQATQGASTVQHDGAATDGARRRLKQWDVHPADLGMSDDDFQAMIAAMAASDGYYDGE